MTRELCRCYSLTDHDATCPARAHELPHEQTTVTGPAERLEAPAERHGPAERLFEPAPTQLAGQCALELEAEQ